MSIKKHNKYLWQTALFSLLLILSFVFYVIHFIFFKDIHHIFLYLVGDIAFLPVEVLLVTFVIHRLLESREKKSILKKMNMVIGAFFSETGNYLLKQIYLIDNNKDKLQEIFNINDFWKTKDFNQALKILIGYKSSLSVDGNYLKEFKKTIIPHKLFLLGLLENPNLLEHETFTDLLWAIFHLIEELSCREYPDKISSKDSDHIKGDIIRVYNHILKEWVLYIKHLKDNYPYLFSLANRTNIFNPKANVEF